MPPGSRGCLLATFTIFTLVSCGHGGSEQPGSSDGGAPSPGVDAGGDRSASQERPSASDGAAPAPPAPGLPSFQRVIVDRSSPMDPWIKEVGDLNGDRLPDLVVSGAGGPIVWYEAPGWTKHTLAGSASSESGSAVADLDGDGDLDLVVGKTWYENAGKGASFTPHNLSGGSAGTHDIVVADVDGDHRPDVVVRGETQTVVTVFLQAARGAFTAFDLQPGMGLNGLDVADLNGDGRPDVVVGGVWMENPGGALATAAWPRHTFAASWNGYATVKAADLDGDHRTDLVLSVSEGVGNLSWFKGPAFTETVIDRQLDHVHSVMVLDLDHDGRLDVIASEYAGSGRLIAYLQGAGSFSAHELGRDRLHNVRAADVDADGDLDFFGSFAFGVNPLVLYRNLGAGPAPPPKGDRRVLVFSRTLGFRHDSIPSGIAALQALGMANGFTVDATEDATQFTSANLARYQAIVFLNPSGDVLDGGQRMAFQQYIEAGGGFVGIHNPTALTLEDWDWYTKLLGARYVTEISTQPCRLQIVEPNHPSTQGLPNPWMATFESYNWDVNPKVNGVTVLINLDETSVTGGTNGPDHPFSWYHAYDGGRAFYTVGGADAANYRDPSFLKHILGGIQYAAGF